MKADKSDSVLILDKDLKELRHHGRMEYPVAMYQIDVKKIHMEIVPWHWHDEVEFIYVLEGGGLFLASDESHLLSKGQGVLINSSVLHAFHLSEEYENCVFISVVFRSDFLVSNSTGERYGQYISPVVDNKQLRTFVIDEKDEDIQKIAVETKYVYNMNKEKSFGYEMYTKGYLMQLWAVILNYLIIGKVSTNDFNQRESLDEKRTKEALIYIEKHYKEDITLDDIAEHIHVSRSECCRCLKRCMDLSPFEYLMKYRVLTAANMLLKDRSISISQLAQDVGFNSSSYFNKLFKKYMGCTPTEYKKKEQADF